MPTPPLPPPGGQPGPSQPFTFGGLSAGYSGAGNVGGLSTNYPVRQFKTPLRPETDPSASLFYVIIASISILAVVMILWMFVRKRKRGIKRKFW